MNRIMCKSKIHRATVKQAELDYIGSITIDKTLLEAADIIPYEQVHVVNINNGERFVTYAIEGEADSGVICLNGAAARLAQVNDLIIIISYGSYSEEEMQTFKEKVVFVDGENRRTQT